MSKERCTEFNQNHDKFVAILVAAGKGERSGLSQPKQYEMFLGEALFIHSLRLLANHPENTSVILVHAPNDGKKITALLTGAGLLVPKVKLVKGGENRSQSVRNGLAALSDDAPNVLIHDAARPGLNHKDLNALLDALGTHDGAAPALPVVDTLKLWRGGNISTQDRSNLYRIQTPQAFRLNALRPVIASDHATTHDEFELAEKAGLNLTLTQGSERLSKLTYADDFKRLEALMSTSETRTGLGYDVHAFEDGDKVILCGVDIPHDKKLKGHSDADVGWHALTDAILGALAEGDIGDHFPPSDPKWKGAPSSVFLKHAADLVEKAGARIINLDLTLICEAPKIKPHRDAMRQSTANLLGLDVSRISVKATTTEGLGFEGRKEGIAAQAIASITFTTRT